MPTYIAQVASKKICLSFWVARFTSSFFPKLVETHIGSEGEMPLC